MGREIRRVPPNWEHPVYTMEDAPRGDRIGSYRPLFDRDYEETKREWLDGLAAWEGGTHPSRTADSPKDWWDWEGDAPRRADYVAYTEAEATWYQMYETVSEGTPLSPAFATPEELIDWLCANKDFWGYGPRTRETAERFVKMAWAPSMVIFQSPDGSGAMGDGIDMLAHLFPPPSDAP